MKEKSNKKNKVEFQKIIDVLTAKFRLVVLDNESFEEKRAFVLSWAAVIIYFLFSFLFLSAIIFLLISFTSLKQIIPGYPDTVEQELLKTKYIENLLKLNSIEEKVAINSLYYSNLEKILNGEVIIDSVHKNSDTTFELDTNNLDFNKSINDSLLRLKIKEREKYDISIVEQSQNTNDNLRSVLFFSPLKGEITSPFNYKNGHNGIDVIASKNEAVKAVLEGTVIFSDWSPENGHVIQIQHEKNIISMYKHNSFLLKKTGDRVSAGDPIAIVGNSGSLSTGPHLHFELWFNGVPLDPEKFIIFE
ncbi:MAG: M23 family metallopeptidase [Flavobacteriales bacterium]|nr:M23 family metallopeptidase [Flavobacteriales bacterium]